MSKEKEKKVLSAQKALKNREHIKSVSKIKCFIYLN
jgi:hypothetical protein